MTSQISNSWNRYHEELLKKWAQMSKTYSIMHSLCGSYYANWHKRLGIPVVIIGGVTASSIFSSNKDNSQVWTYINGSLALLVAALSGISSFVGTAEKTNKHQNASFKYTKIAMDIDTILSFSRCERVKTPQEFIQEKKSEMLEIRENVPEVLPWVMNNYLEKFDKSLTDTKSKVNKCSESYIQPKLKVMFDEYTPSERGTGSTSSSDNAIGSDSGRLVINIKEGEMLADFADKEHEKIQKASEKMKIPSESDSEEEAELTTFMV
jgi:hypothetical protein